jgi:hypothetical protein
MVQPLGQLGEPRAREVDPGRDLQMFGQAGDIEAAGEVQPGNLAHILGKARQPLAVAQHQMAAAHAHVVGQGAQRGAPGEVEEYHPQPARQGSQGHTAVQDQRAGGQVFGKAGQRAAAREIEFLAHLDICRQGRDAGFLQVEHVAAQSRADGRDGLAAHHDPARREPGRQFGRPLAADGDRRRAQARRELRSGRPCADVQRFGDREIG